MEWQYFPPLNASPVSFVWWWLVFKRSWKYSLHLPRVSPSLLWSLIDRGNMGLQDYFIGLPVFRAHPEYQATWHTGVNQTSHRFKPLNISGRISSQPAVFWQQGRLRLQWWYFPPPNVPPPCPMLWKWLDLRNTHAICQECPYHCCITSRFGFWWI